MKHSVAQEDFSRKKSASYFLYCLNNSAFLKWLISSLSPPCSTFRNSLRSLINTTYKSTSLPLTSVSIWCSILCYIQTHLMGVCWLPLFHFSLPKPHCFSFSLENYREEGSAKRRAPQWRCCLKRVFHPGPPGKEGMACSPTVLPPRAALSIIQHCFSPTKSVNCYWKEEIKQNKKNSPTVLTITLPCYQCHLLLNLHWT